MTSLQNGSATRKPSPINPSPGSPAPRAESFHLTEYTGIIHLHSAYSFDGRTPVADIIKAANESGVDFLLLTDHSTLKARDDGFEGWHNGTLLIVGEEIAPRFNHYLAFQLAESVTSAGDPRDLPPQATIDRVRAGGGLGFIAHPDHEGNALFHVKHYPWIDWKVNGYNGIGIWDFMTDWQKSLSGYLPAVLSYAFPAFFLRGPSPDTLARWDLLTQERRVVGIGELDNHDTLKRVFGTNLSVFPYARVLRLIRTHVLTAGPLSGNSRDDIAVLFDALKNGRAYVALDYYRSSSGFSLLLKEEGRYAAMGDEFQLRSCAELRVSVPYRGRIAIIRNGTLFHRATGKTLSVKITEPGVYRTEVSLRIFGRYHPWIFSNPIYVTCRSR
ncbi:MAG: hypothetical protein FJ122_03000 [Deltaproteobacteria bacterium]|nr:hypothetical protein [Deltaproteobacteria bacterium]